MARKKKTKTNPRKPTGPKPLSPRQLEFVRLFLELDDATESYIRAGFKVKSRKVAQVNGSRLLSNAMVQAAVKAARDKALQGHGVTADWVIRNMKALATDTGFGTSHAARVRATECLGKMHRLFPDRHEHSGPHGAPIGLNLSRLTDAELNDLDAILARAEATGEGEQPPSGAGGTRPA